jgi:hypothetical protein
VRSSPAGTDAGGTRHGGHLGARSEHQPTGPSTTLSVGLKNAAAPSRTQKHRSAQLSQVNAQRKTALRIDPSRRTGHAVRGATNERRRLNRSPHTGACPAPTGSDRQRDRPTRLDEPHPPIDASSLLHSADRGVARHQIERRDTPGPERSRRSRCRSRRARPRAPSRSKVRAVSWA